MRQMLWADIVPAGYYDPPPASSYWPEVRDMDCNLLGNVKITTSEYPWYFRNYWRFVLRHDIAVPKWPLSPVAEFAIETMDLPVAEFRIGGRSDKWYGFQTDKTLDELKLIPCFATTSDASAEHE